MSKNYCCVPGCAKSGEAHPVLHVFPNPTKGIDRFRSWVHAIGGDIVGLNNDTIYKNRRVCHRHFDEIHCCRFNKLSCIAVPRLYLPGLSTIPQYSVTVGRTCLRSIQNIEDDLSIPSTSKESNAQYSRSCIIGPQITISAEVSENENKENRPAQPPAYKIPSTSLSNLTLDNIERTLFLALNKKKTATPKVRVTKNRCKLTLNEKKLYMKLVQTRNKLSKLRSKSKLQSVSIKLARKLASNPQFLSTLEAFTIGAKILTTMQFREHKKKSKGQRFTLII